MGRNEGGGEEEDVLEPDREDNKLGERRTKLQEGSRDTVKGAATGAFAESMFYMKFREVTKWDDTGGDGADR